MYIAQSKISVITWYEWTFIVENVNILMNSISSFFYFVSSELRMVYVLPTMKEWQLKHPRWLTRYTVWLFVSFTLIFWIFTTHNDTCMINDCRLYLSAPYVLLLLLLLLMLYWLQHHHNTAAASFYSRPPKQHIADGNTIEKNSGNGWQSVCGNKMELATFGATRTIAVRLPPMQMASVEMLS